MTAMAAKRTERREREPPRGGDRSEGVLALYREHGANLYGYALGILGDRADAEDVTQDAFIKLDRHLQLGRTDSNLRAWLYRVVLNSSRDLLRARSRRAEPPDDSPGPTPQPLRTLALHRVLQRLATRDRELVLLRGHGLSYAEMAETLDVRPSSLGTLLARALERFATFYADEIGPDEGGRR